MRSLCHETDLSAEQDQTEAHPRISGAHADQGRTGRDPAPPGQGAQAIGRLGFPRARRLPDRAGFTACFDGGRRYFTEHFVVFALLREGDGTWRLGLTVTRKTGSAVKRNRVKRVLREFFRLHQNMVDAPLDLVVVPKRTLDPACVDLPMVRHELLPVLSRLRTLRSTPSGGPE